MKKTLLTILILIIGTTMGFCQSQKNDLKLTVAGLPLFGSSDGFDSDINGIVLKPSFGYFISDRTSLDFNFSYASLNDLRVTGVDSHYNSYAFVPAIRNNFVNNPKLRVFAEFGFGLGTIKYEADNSNFRTTRHQELSGGISILNLGIGGNYFFHEKFGLEVIIPYLSTKNITSDNIDYLYSGIGPTVGLTYKVN